MPLNLTELKTHFPHIIFHFFNLINSTNTFFKEEKLFIKKNQIQLCLADHQTAGRGRFGKIWVSPPETNLYFSLLWPTQKTQSELSGLSLVIALALANALTPLNLSPHLKIKWPNDLFWGNKKLAGILIEFTQIHPHHIIIGIGLNVNMQITKDISRGTSLFECTQHTFNRTTLLCLLLETILSDLKKFEEKGFSSFLREWASWDYLYKKNITLKTPQHIIEGIACGINEHGHLLIQNTQGEVNAYLSGSILAYSSEKK